MIKYEYKGKQYDWLSDIRKDIWETDRVVFGAWDDLVKEQFGVTEVMIPDPVTPPYEPTDEELARQVRYERDRKLEETDWYMMPDYPADPETLEIVKNYRKALRDITLQSGFPRDVKWPVVPKVFCEDTEGAMGLGLAKGGI